MYRKLHIDHQLQYPAFPTRSAPCSPTATAEASERDDEDLTWRSSVPISLPKNIAKNKRDSHSPLNIQSREDDLSITSVSFSQQIPSQAQILAMSVSERIEFAARHEDLIEALNALNAWVEIKNTSAGMSLTHDTADQFFASKAMEILIQRLLDQLEYSIGQNTRYT
jgi:hypothetical protein